MIPKRVPLAPRVWCESGGSFSKHKKHFCDTSRVWRPRSGPRTTTTTQKYRKFTYTFVVLESTCFAVQKIGGRFCVAWHGVSSPSRIARGRRGFWNFFVFSSEFAFRRGEARGNVTEMLRALEKVTTLTHSRGVDVATLARNGLSQSKEQRNVVNSRRKPEAPLAFYENSQRFFAFGFVTARFVREWQHRHH